MRRRIIRRIAIGEPVRHEQVNHIVRTKTLEPAPGFQRTIQSQLKFASPGSVPDLKVIGARLDLLADVHISKQIMAVVRSITGLNLETFGRRRHGRALEIVSRQEKLDRIQRVRHPPVGRIHFRDGGRRSGVNR